MKLASRMERIGTETAFEAAGGYSGTLTMTYNADSPNKAWRNLSFRGYADHMETDEFRAGGRIPLTIGGKSLDVRVSTLPSRAGERVALRILDKAVSKGVIHSNQAANRKSALAKAVSGL